MQSFKPTQDIYLFIYLLKLAKRLSPNISSVVQANLVLTAESIVSFAKGYLLWQNAEYVTQNTVVKCQLRVVHNYSGELYRYS